MSTILFLAMAKFIKISILILNFRSTREKGSYSVVFLEEASSTFGMVVIVWPYVLSFCFSVR